MESLTEKITFDLEAESKHQDTIEQILNKSRLDLQTHENAITSIRVDHESQIAKLQKSHADEIESLRIYTIKELESKVLIMKAKADSVHLDHSRLNQEMILELETLRVKYGKSYADAERSLGDLHKSSIYIAKLKDSQELILAELKEAHGTQLAEMKNIASLNVKYVAELARARQDYHFLEIDHQQLKMGCQKSFDILEDCLETLAPEVSIGATEARSLSKTAETLVRTVTESIISFQATCKNMEELKEASGHYEPMIATLSAKLDSETQKSNTLEKQVSELTTQNMRYQMEVDIYKDLQVTDRDKIQVTIATLQNSFDANSAKAAESAILRERDSMALIKAAELASNKTSEKVIEVAVAKALAMAEKRATSNQSKLSPTVTNIAMSEILSIISTSETATSEKVPKKVSKKAKFVNASELIIVPIFLFRMNQKLLICLLKRREAKR